MIDDGLVRIVRYGRLPRGNGGAVGDAAPRAAGAVRGRGRVGVQRRPFGLGGGGRGEPLAGLFATEFQPHDCPRRGRERKLVASYVRRGGVRGWKIRFDSFLAGVKFGIWLILIIAVRSKEGCQD